MIDIKSLTLPEVEKEIIALGFKRFRAKQINDWLKKGVSSFKCMRNLPENLITKLPQYYYISVVNIEKKFVSSYDKTVKYLFSLIDGNIIEAVVMKYKYGYSMCISTQVGCRMGCTFCATGKQGLTRSLTAGEMISEIEAAQRDLEVRISNIVLMGMGEPLDNFEEVTKFLKLVSSPDSLKIGGRHITLSTCGVVPKIYELADKDFQLTLSISLHAPDDETRSRTMPINKAYNIKELIKAAKYYIKKTGRRVTFEYAMIDGVNDSDISANKLGELLKGMLCHVNLIPVNSVEGTPYRKSKADRLKRFISIFESYGINATVRRTLGSDISASCGQLKGKTVSCETKQHKTENKKKMPDKPYRWFDKDKSQQIKNKSEREG